MKATDKCCIAGIILLYLVLAMAYSIVTPLFEGPDEWSHFTYIQYLAKEHRLPSLQGLEAGLYEAHHPPLYYFLSALMASVGPTDDRGVVYTIRALRLFSIVAGAATVFVTYQIGRVIFPGDYRVALCAAMLNATIPQYTFITAMINNDSLAALLSSLCIFLGASALCEKALSLKRAILLGLAVGLALLTKSNTLPLAAFIVLAVVIKGRFERKVLRWCGVILGVVALISGWYFVRNHILYGDPLGWSIFPTLIPGLYDPQPIVSADTWRWFLRECLPTVWITFWAVFGKCNVFIHPYLYNLLSVIAAVGSLGLVWLLSVGCSGAHREYKSGLLFLLAVVGITLAALTRLNLMISAAQGRLMFPAISAICVLLASGLSSGLESLIGLPPSGRFRNEMFVGPLIMLTVNIVCLRYYVIPAYFHLIR